MHTHKVCKRTHLVKIVVNGSRFEMRPLFIRKIFRFQACRAKVLCMITYRLNREKPFTRQQNWTRM